LLWLCEGKEKDAQKQMRKRAQSLCSKEMDDFFKFCVFLTFLNENLVKLTLFVVIAVPTRFHEFIL